MWKSAHNYDNHVNMNIICTLWVKFEIICAIYCKSGGGGNFGSHVTIIKKKLFKLTHLNLFVYSLADSLIKFRAVCVCVKVISLARECRGSVVIDYLDMLRGLLTLCEQLNVCPRIQTLACVYVLVWGVLPLIHEESSFSSISSSSQDVRVTSK